MAQEVGVAYVTLLPSGRGFGKAVEGQIDQAVGKSEKKTDGFFSKVGTGLKRVGVGVAAVVGTVAAIAVTGGISRALNIEDAQAKLKGLGHDTKAIETIMKDALASVKGTAFGLDAAATTAAAAVASGIKPGKELEGYLRLTADAATIAGVSMEEMGSIMNKVQAKGRAQMEDLNRLTERGIPIMQMLADEYGVTAEEMSKMVSKGEVDSERFRKALEKNVGGAALESGNTTRGAFANMRAALSRLGLVFVEDGLGGAKTFFNEVTVILDGLAERFRPWVQGIKDRLSGMFEIEGFGDNFLKKFDEISASIKNGPIPAILNALQPVLPVLAEAAELIGGALGDAFKELGESLAPHMPEIAQSLADAAVELAPALADLLVALAPLIPPLVELLAALVPIAVEILEGSVPALQELIPWLTDSAGAWSAFAGLVNGEMDLDGFSNKLRNTGGPFSDFIRNLGDSAFEMGFWAGSIGWGIDKAVRIIAGLPARAMAPLAALPGMFRAVGEQMVQGLANGITARFATAVAAVRALAEALPRAVKKVLGINSPSRVFRDEVGKMVGLGLLEGIEDASIRGRIDTSVNHLVNVPDVGLRAGARITQQNEINIQDRDPRVILRQLGRELNGALA